MFIILTTITIILLAGVSIYSFDRTYYNSENETGNTTGNIYNGGLYVERDNKIYFSNEMDEGKLYVMSAFATGAAKVSDDKVRYINADGNYIYYVRVNQTKANNNDALFQYNNNGIYRIDESGLNLKVISNQPGAYLFLSGNDLYFQRYTVKNDLHFYRNKIDGTNERLLMEEELIPTRITEKRMYFAGNDDNPSLRYLDLSSYNDHTEIEGNITYPIYQDNFIYYIDGDQKNRLYRMKEDGSDPELLVKKSISSYNVTLDGRYLIYQISNKKGRSINRLNLTTMESELIREGNHSNIHVTTHNIFFKESKSNTTFIAPSVGKLYFTEFIPMDLEAEGKDKKSTDKD